jgi:hypothetical protein
MTYSVGNSEVANYANTSSGKVTNVVADNGVGGSGEAVNVVDRAALSFVVATNIQFLTIDVTSLSGYIAGKSDVTITVNPNVYVYGTNPTYTNQIPFYSLNKPDASMQIIGGAVGDTIKLVNNGNIVGYGGDGGGVHEFTSNCPCGYDASGKPPSPGNAALTFITPGITLSIENNGYIAGGGGGGGSVGGNLINGNSPGGGGGAGGGISGVVGLPAGSNAGSPTVRAVPPNAGNNGVTSSVLFGCCNSVNANGGGGGGFVLPGVGGAYDQEFDYAGGGGAGGGGMGASTNFHAYNNNGGSANNAAPTYTTFGDAYQGGGGGGWGASGASGYTNTTLFEVGAAGGNSIITNGNAYTLTGSGQLYGSVNTAIRTVAYTFPTTNYQTTFFDISSIPGYTTTSNVVLLVPAGVVLTSETQNSAGLEILNFAGASTSSIRIVINGAILGAGGIGGSESVQSVGGDALYINETNIGQIIIDNTNGYIAGGGGGGGRSQNTLSLGTSTVVTYGGGGAGYQGSSGTNGNVAYNPGVSSGVSTGTNGTVVVGAVTYASGGSGGTILPGTRTFNTGTFAVGTYAGKGGTAGGSGAFNATATIVNPNNFGGAFQENGSFVAIAGFNNGGGGGGWGAAGGAGRRGTTPVQSGRAGGKSIKLLNGGTQVYVTNPTKLAGTIGV